MAEAMTDGSAGREAALDAWEAVVDAAREEAQQSDQEFKNLRLTAIVSLEEQGCDRREIAQRMKVTPGAISYLVGRKEGRPPGAPRGRGAKKVAE